MTLKDTEADLLLIQEQLGWAAGRLSPRKVEIDDKRRGQLRREYRNLHARWMAAKLQNGEPKS